jgi:hypothetical protein
MQHPRWGRNGPESRKLVIQKLGGPSRYRLAWKRPADKRVVELELAGCHSIAPVAVIGAVRSAAILNVLLAGGRTVAARRIAGAYRLLGNDKAAP